MRKTNGTMGRAMLILAVTASLAACAMPGQREDDDIATMDSGSTPPAQVSPSAEVSFLPTLQISPELRIKDLPIPAGYLYRTDKSMILEYGQVQAGILLYEGSATAGDLVAFYRREMPKFDWNMMSMIEREDIRIMFEKAGKNCEVMIKSGTSLSKKTVISIYYAPK